MSSNFTIGQGHVLSQGLCCHRAFRYPSIDLKWAQLASLCELCGHGLGADLRGNMHERQLWVVHDGRPKSSDFHSFRDCECVLQFDTEVHDRGVHFGMAKQELDCAQDAGFR